MPTRREHIAQTKHNLGMLRFIDQNDKADCYMDWYVTVAFYAALHQFEAILPIVCPKINRLRKKVRLKDHYYDHNERLLAMGDRAFKSVYIPYYSLYSYSRLAKYNCYSTATYTRVQVAKDLKGVIYECRKVVANMQ